MLLLRLLLTLILMLVLIVNLILLCIVTKLNSVGRRHCRDALKRRRRSRTDDRRRTRAAERFEAAAVIPTATAICIRICIAKRIVVHTRYEQVQLVVGKIRTTGRAVWSVIRRVNRETAVSTAVV